MSDVKQESLANAKVRIGTQQQSGACMKAPAKKSTVNQRKEHNVDLKSTFSG